MKSAWLTIACRLRWGPNSSATNSRGLKLSPTQDCSGTSLSERIIGAWNDKIICRCRGQEQEESFRGAARVDLPEEMKIARSRSDQHRKSKPGFELLTNPAEYSFLGLPDSHKG